jgi:hypothetical protein
MAEADQVSELVGNIYDASIDPSLWPRVLEQTCGYVHGIAAVLVAHKASAGAGELYFSWGDDPAYTESYNQTFCKGKVIYCAIIIIKCNIQIYI